MSQGVPSVECWLPDSAFTYSVAWASLSLVFPLAGLGPRVAGCQ